MPWWGGLDLRVWQYPDPWLDWMVPCAAVLIVVISYFAAVGALREFVDCVIRHNLAYAQQVQQLDTSGIAPTSHAVGAPTELREDRPAPCLPRDLALSQAPEAARGAGLFKVPRVLV